MRPLTGLGRCWKSSASMNIDSVAVGFKSNFTHNLNHDIESEL